MTMIVDNPSTWRRERLTQIRDGLTLGFVPTMGALHGGHASLIKRARYDCATVVVSIFVNPLQFGPGEDLERYPRDLERDRRLASARRVDALFTPSVDAMYPSGSEVRVVPGPSADRWEGAARPGSTTCSLGAAPTREPSVVPHAGRRRIRNTASRSFV